MIINKWFIRLIHSCVQIGMDARRCPIHDSYDMDKYAIIQECRCSLIMSISGSLDAFFLSVGIAHPTLLYSPSFLSVLFSHFSIFFPSCSLFSLLSFNLFI